MKGSIYVGSRLVEIDLVRAVQKLCTDAHYSIAHDWTKYGNVRGNAAALRQASVEQSRACSRCSRMVLLLANGDRSRSAGIHVELGAFLGAAWTSDGAPDLQRRALIWTPPAFAHVFDPTHQRTLGFYHDPRVDLAHSPREDVLEVVRDWLSDFPQDAR